MHFGLFCLYENPHGDYGRAFREQHQLATDAEALGFDEVWVAEHHFDPDNASPSCLLLLAHIAAITQKVRIGAAAVLLPFRDPIQVAEDIATLDQLSGGRLEVGVAKGGPFPAQNRHFKVDKEHSRDRLLEALEIVERLLDREQVSHDGECFRLDGVALAPRPLQARIPFHVASATPETLRYAAKHGHGIMGASPFPRDRLLTMAEHYRWFSGGRSPEFSVSRFYLAAPTREAALEEARPYIHRFAEHKRTISRQQGGEAPPALDEEALIERSLIGSYEEVAEGIADLAANVGVHRLLLKPASLDHGRCRDSLARFVDEIRPRLPAPLLDRRAA